MKTQDIIFTDLDGSLLDHFSYQFDVALATLKALDKNKIPIVCATSKTFAELCEIRKKLNNAHPMIVENGAAIYIPKGYFSDEVLREVKIDDAIQGYQRISFSRSRTYWSTLLDKIEGISVDAWQSFSAMELEGIIEHTGLSKTQAMQANEREFSEPVLWLGTQTQKAEFIAQLSALGANVLEGGRFLHITDHTDKGKTLNTLCQLYEKHFQCNICSIALGDGKNDLPMIYQANQGVLIRSQANPLPEFDHQTNIYVTDKCGPKGWVEAVECLVINPLND